MELKVPLDFNPTTATPIHRPDDHVCHRVRPRGAFLSVRHSVTLSIEMSGAESISIEAGVYLVGISTKQCEDLVQQDPEIVPGFDYSKFIGLEDWVPQYSETRDFVTEFKNDLHIHEINNMETYRREIASSEDASDDDSDDTDSSPPPEYTYSIDPSLEPRLTLGNYEYDNIRQLGSRTNSRRSARNVVYDVNDLDSELLQAMSEPFF